MTDVTNSETPAEAQVWHPDNLCRLCDKPIKTAELCKECAKGNDPFFICDNSASDMKR